MGNVLAWGHTIKHLVEVLLIQNFVKGRGQYCGGFWHAFALGWDNAGLSTELDATGPP